MHEQHYLLQSREQTGPELGGPVRLTRQTASCGDRLECNGGAALPHELRPYH